MKNLEIEHKIDKAIEEVTPDVLLKVTMEIKNDESRKLIMNKIDTNETKIVDITDADIVEKESKKAKGFNKKSIFRGAGVAVAACFVMVVGTFAYTNNFVEASRVELDVNPSVSISLNKQGEVIDAVAMNDDGTEILADLDVKSLELETAVNEIVDELYEEGFINEKANSTLVTVFNDEEAKATEIENEVVNMIANRISEKNITPDVIAQKTTMAQNDNLETLARQFGISYSKALLILNAVELEGSLTFEELARMNINQISEYYDDMEDNYDDDSVIGKRLEAIEDLIDDIEDDKDDQDDDSDDQDDKDDQNNDSDDQDDRDADNKNNDNDDDDDNDDNDKDDDDDDDDDDNDDRD